MLNDELEEQLSAINHELLVRKARESLEEYAAMVYPNYKHTKVHKYLCNKIQEFLDTERKGVSFLLLSFPPQHGKSLHTSEIIPAWRLGNHPEERIITVSYSSDFCETFGRKNKDKCLEFNPDIFPGFKLRESPCTNSEFHTDKGGYAKFIGWTGGATGRQADLIICDDLLKNAEESMSDTTKEALWNEFLYSLLTRLSANGKVIVIQTRWCLDDLYGRILEEMDPETVVNINVPVECIDEENDPLGRKLGDSLCPEIGKDNEWLKAYKKVYTSENGSKAWQALFMGDPQDDGSAMFKPNWFKYYDYDELPDMPYQIIAVDAAFKASEANDFTAITVWGKRDQNYYLLDGVNAHLNFNEMLAEIRRLREEYPEVMFVLIETAANGQALIDVLSHEMDGVIPVPPQGSKQSRAQSTTGAYESGRVWFPKDSPLTKELVKQLVRFPNGCKHDDLVDSASYALNRMIYVDADVIAPDKIVYKHWEEDQWEDYENADDELKIYLISIWGYPENYGDFN